MIENLPLTEDAARKTRNAFYFSRLLDAPFWAIFILLPYLLYKDLHISQLQMYVLLSIKPLSSIGSIYWSSLIDKQRKKLKPNIIWGGVLRHLPFLFFPFFDNAWFFIISYGFHMTLSRGTHPAWIEIFKLNIQGPKRDKIYAYGCTLGHIGDTIFPLILGTMLDKYFFAWKWIFVICATLPLFSIFLQRKIPIQPDLNENESKISEMNLLKPWKETWELLKKRKDFFNYQMCFMLSGCGLMVMQPAVMSFFVDELHLNYTEMTAALTTFKGIGFALTSHFWANWITKMNIFKLSSIIAFLLSLFPLFIFMSLVNISWIYIGYLCYGMMQAGSSLSWGMSGAIFAKEEESSLFSTVNVLSVGLRGCFAPAFGILFCSWLGAKSVLLFGGLLCLMATYKFIVHSKRIHQPEAA